MVSTIQTAAAAMLQGMTAHYLTHIHLCAQRAAIPAWFTPRRAASAAGGPNGQDAWRAMRAFSLDGKVPNTRAPSILAIWTGQAATGPPRREPGRYRRFLST